ncbi:ubiquinone biosynthesis protein [Fluviicoccus keumensis]|uniref:Ubiquinone biosynthesis protein n=1 Tax=Fluviicoccus keumensis TaxID=1435465 RepID=A0A4Q7Z9I4_9GAMM|nr:AarF/UbiB family protein [Fluviicoccus keumensis]RZU46721.1 ubiquinone biosynthesis protein [Fluviicoccus keumensis]
MLAHLPRLLVLWRIVAFYRLDKLVPADAPIPLPVRAALLLVRLHPAWWSAEGMLATYSEGERLRKALEEMGPLFIKLGQLLSTRRDLLPPGLLDELSKLQDRVPPFPSDTAKAIVEQELGGPVSQFFSRFDEQPLAAASIAQVHTACRLDGREVIVKIARPGLEQAIQEDFGFLKAAAEWLEARSPAMAAFHAWRIVCDYEQVLLGELDLLQEAANTTRMRNNFPGSNLIYVPEVHHDLCTHNVMVEERIYGVPVSDNAAFERLGVNRKVLAEKGLTVFFTQVFNHNFFHADMHPGNIFVETTDPANPRYIALDCAIMGELSDKDHLTVARLMMSVMQNDFTQLIDVAHQAGWIPPSTDIPGLTREIRRLLTPMLQKRMDQLDFAPILLGVLDVARRYHLEVPPQLVLLMKTLVHVEGLGRELYPELDIWSLGKPLLGSWLAARMNPAESVKSLMKQTPAMILGLSDLPGLVWDSLNNLRNSAAWQERQWRELQQLQYRMAADRRRDWLALSGFVLGLAGVVSSTGLSAFLCLLVMVLSVVWRLLA